PGGVGAYPGACEWARPGGELFLAHPAQGAHPERLRHLGGGRSALAPVGGAVQRAAPSVQVEVRPAAVGRVPPTAGGQAYTLGTGPSELTLELFLPRTTKHLQGDARFD